MIARKIRTGSPPLSSRIVSRSPQKGCNRKLRRTSAACGRRHSDQGSTRTQMGVRSDARVGETTAQRGSGTIHSLRRTGVQKGVSGDMKESVPHPPAATARSEVVAAFRRGLQAQQRILDRAPAHRGSDRRLQASGARGPLSSVFDFKFNASLGPFQKKITPFGQGVGVACLDLRRSMPLEPNTGRLESSQGRALSFSLSLGRSGVSRRMSK